MLGDEGSEAGLGRLTHLPGCVSVCGLVVDWIQSLSKPTSQEGGAGFTLDGGCDVETVCHAFALVPMSPRDEQSLTRTQAHEGALIDLLRHIFMQELIGRRICEQR